jgi:hypothetical protein
MFNSKVLVMLLIQLFYSLVFELAEQWERELPSEHPEASLGYRSIHR